MRAVFLLFVFLGHVITYSNTVVVVVVVVVVGGGGGAGGAVYLYTN